MCSHCLPSSAPAQPFRQRYSRSLSLKYWLVWVSAFCLTHMLQPQFLFYLFEFTELAFLWSPLKQILPLFSVMTSWTAFSPVFGHMVVLARYCGFTGYSPAVSVLMPSDFLWWWHSNVGVCIMGVHSLSSDCLFTYKVFTCKPTSLVISYGSFYST